MKVWRKQTVKRRDGKRIVVESKRWYGTLRLAHGKRKQVPLCEDRGNSETLLRRLQCGEDEKRANGADRYSNYREQPIGELVDEYRACLVSKGNTRLHVSMTTARLNAVLLRHEPALYPTWMRAAS